MHYPHTLAMFSWEPTGSFHGYKVEKERVILRGPWSNPAMFLSLPASARPPPRVGLSERC